MKLTVIFDNVIDLRNCELFVDRKLVFADMAKMKNDVTSQLYFSTGPIAGSFNFMLQEQHQCHLWLLVSK